LPGLQQTGLATALPSSPTPRSPGLLRVPQRRQAGRVARRRIGLIWRPTGPICCTVCNVDPAARWASVAPDADPDTARQDRTRPRPRPPRFASPRSRPPRFASPRSKPPRSQSPLSPPTDRAAESKSGRGSAGARAATTSAGGQQIRRGPLSTDHRSVDPRHLVAGCDARAPPGATHTTPPACRGRSAHRRRRPTPRRRRPQRTIRP